MDRGRLAELVVALGRAFRVREMKSHVRSLRLYYLALKHGLVTGERHQLKAEWTEDAVIEWLRILRVPPYHSSYPVLPRGSVCPKCPKGDGHPVETTTLLTFAGGAKMGCRRCAMGWIELDEESRAVIAETAVARRPVKGNRH